jgi:hypothetical protein
MKVQVGPLAARFGLRLLVVLDLGRRFAVVADDHVPRAAGNGTKTI